MSLFVLIGLVIVLILIASALLVVLGGMRTKGHLERALNMTLFLVRVPREALSKEDTIQRMRELISVGEQMLSSFSNLHSKGWNKFIYGEPYLSLEVAVHSDREDTYFYLAMPKSNEDTIEKQIYSFYPTAEITRVNDYNIFTTNGASAGAYVHYTKEAMLPIKTYQKLETDPLGSILTSMSKLQAVGEGAAFQILIRPSHDESQKSFALKVAREMQSGYQYKEAYQRAVKTPKVDPEKAAQEAQRPRTVTPTEEEIIKAITTKAGKKNFDVNIRLLTSAESEPRAQQILQEFEGSLTQFATHDLNSFKIANLTGKALEKLIYQFAFRLFEDKQAVTMSTEEVMSLYHFPISMTAAPKVHFLKAKPAEPPSTLPAEGIMLGTNYFRGEERIIRMTQEDRRRHLYSIGQTGAGKSTFLKQLVRQDIEAGHGVCVMDPAGDFAEYALSIVPKERAEDVVYFNPADISRPIGLNMFEIDPSKPEQKTLVINELLGIFDKLYNLKETGGPVFEKYFKNSALLLLDDYEHEIPVLADIPRVLTDEKFRADKLSRETNPLVIQFWTQEAEKAGGEAALANMAPYISTKVDTFVSNEFLRPILNQKISAFNFRQAMDEQKIIICKFSKGEIGDLNAQLMGLLVVGKLLIAAFSRVNIEENDRKDFYLYMDEFQNFATDSIATILSEARKYRLDMIIAHQYIKQLPEKIRDAVFGNVGSMVAFRIGIDDADYLKNKFEPVFNVADLTNIDNLNAYVTLLINGQTARPFNMKIDFPPAGTPEMFELLKELSSLKYGRSREEVDEEIKAHYAAGLK